jgi:uncharacterized protein (TIGR02246 family)
MKYPLALLLAGASTASFSLQAAESTAQCQATDEAQVSALFQRWNEDLASGEPKRVVENYAEESILLPTLSNLPRRTADEKQDYFVHFLEKKPSGTVDERMIQIDCNTALDAGIYTFSFADGNKVKARYSFTYKWYPEKEQWLITSHHSSTMPEIVPMLD